jgi:hypothetical protein
MFEKGYNRVKEEDRFVDAQLEVPLSSALLEMRSPPFRAQHYIQLYTRTHNKNIKQNTNKIKPYNIGSFGHRFLR